MPTYKADEEAKQKAKEEQRKKERDQFHQDLDDLVNSKFGIRFLCVVLDKGMFMRNLQHSNNVTTQMNLGRRAIAEEILTSLFEYDVALFNKLMEEFHDYRFKRKPEPEPKQ